jgi:DNA-binding IclR family transcriptional regulator
MISRERVGSIPGDRSYKNNMVNTSGSAATEKAKRDPQNHRTVDRVTRILEEVVYHPGMTFGELVRVLDSPKSSVHGFVQGLLAKGWLYEEKNRFYLGPAVYGLTLASGHVRADHITHADLLALHEATGLAVFLGVQAGDHLIYIAESGTDPVEGFAARTDIRRTLLMTAAGKALLAEQGEVDRLSYLRRQGPAERELVDHFLGELEDIKRTRIATNLRGGKRFAIATAVHNRSGAVVAAVTLVGPAEKVHRRAEQDPARHRGWLEKAFGRCLRHRPLRLLSRWST